MAGAKEAGVEGWNEEGAALLVTNPQARAEPPPPGPLHCPLLAGAMNRVSRHEGPAAPEAAGASLQCLPPVGRLVGEGALGLIRCRGPSHRSESSVGLPL